eukprot:2725961-Lingulodinium_polyedra.AAC.1
MVSRELRAALSAACSSCARGQRTRSGPCGRRRTRSCAPWWRWPSSCPWSWPGRGPPRSSRPTPHGRGR